jgi:dihydroxyacid dehydratase/phosphogluconate dehydratase
MGDGLVLHAMVCEKVYLVTEGAIRNRWPVDRHGHAEAACGPIIAVRNGDRIRIVYPKKRLTALVRRRNCGALSNGTPGRALNRAI